MTIKIYNTLTRKKEPFQPHRKGEVTMYVCGPTVYDSAHIGHALSYLAFDMIRRYLEHRGYQVRHVQNFTDVEDKIIDRAKETGEGWDSITTRYIEEFMQEMDQLNILRAHRYPYASQEIPGIIEIIQGLIQKGYAYESEGDVYFRVERDEDYGKLSHRKLEEQQTQERISEEERERKAHPMDFALWKASKPDEPGWDSPWGQGRPGWHIECSVMALRYLGEQIDIHGGGTDLIFPHHENEIAQSESYTGKAPFAKYWIHNGLLQISTDNNDDEKMARSGTMVRLGEMLQAHAADTVRLFVLSSHYRRPATYTEESFAASRRAMERFHAALQPPQAGAAREDPKLAEITEESSKKFHGAMDDDFNTALALGALFELARAINGARDRGVGGSAFEQAQTTLQTLLEVLGFRLDREAPQAGLGADAEPFIELLIETRTKLRKAKQFELADEVRDRMQELGILLEDTPDGTVWKRAEP